MIRSFIAIDLENENTKRNIQTLTEHLKINQPKLKVVEPQNLHMTVKFLGDIKESMAPKIYEVLHKEINQELFKGQKYAYKLKGLGQFNNFSVLWINLIGDIQFLQKVKDQIEDSLFKNHDIKRDKRKKFIPHLTIGRLRKNKINFKTFDSFKNLVNQNKETEFGSFQISEVKLKRSVLTPKGPIYSNLVY